MADVNLVKENLKSDEEKGKKIVPLREKVFYTFLALIFGILTVILYIKAHGYYFPWEYMFFAVCCAVFFGLTVAFVSKLTVFSSYFLVFSYRIEADDTPFFATNKFLGKKSSLIKYNNNISIDEIESIEIVRLTKDERKKYLGFKYPFGKFMKFNIKNGRPKYICVGQYTKKEINRILTLINSNMSNVA